MKKQYAIVHTEMNVIESVRLTKPKDPGPFCMALPCELSSYLRFKALQEAGKNLHNVGFIIENGVVFDNRVYEYMTEDRKRKKLYDTVDKLIECSNDRWPYQSNYREHFKCLQLEEKIEVVFELTFRALVQMKDKEDKKDDFMY
jgi:hypothetical protein